MCQPNKANFIDNLFNKIGEDLSPNQQCPKESSAIPKFEISQKLKSQGITQNSLYNELTFAPQKKVKQLGTESLRVIVNDDNKFESKVEGKQFLIEKYKPKLIMKEKQPIKKLTRKIQKELKMFKLETSKLTYEMFLPLHQLWNEYIMTIVPVKEQIESKFLQLLKADFTGSIIEVINAKCKSYEGISGIVIKETTNTFQIITTENAVLTILKKNSIFLIDIMKDVTVKLFGCRLVINPTNRIKQKFKSHMPNEFILQNQFI